MPVRNQNWYDLNESRPFPVDDTATSIADSGERMPSGLITDLHMKFPEAAGRRAWFGAVTVTPNLVSVTILAATESITAPSFTPLASVYVRASITPRRPYALEAQYPGVGGWITFGQEILSQQWWGKFAAPTQSLLHPSTARSYEDLPIPNAGSLKSSTPLTGIVRLAGGNDIEIVKECREIPNYPPTGIEQCDPLLTSLRDVIVFRLRDINANTDGLPAAAYNVFEKYIGPCGQRPESNNCGDPAPIESLSGVSPDCCGNITINFAGCSIVSEIKEEALVDDMGDVVEVDAACGFVLDCGLGLSDACVTQDRLPAPDGTLPNEYQDLCESVTLVSVSLEPEVSVSPGDSGFPEESASVAADPDLPFTTDFPNAASGDLFTVREGEMLWKAPQEYGSLGSNSASIRNVSTLDADYTPHYKKLTGRFRMLSSSPGLAAAIQSGASVLHNAAMVMDWRLVAGTTNRYQYWVAEVDWDGTYLGYQLFRIALFDGVNYTTFLSVPLPGQLSLDKDYEIQFSAWPNFNLPGRSWLEASLAEVSGPTLATIGPLSVSGYGDLPDVQFGMHSNRAATSWSYFSLENLGA